MRRGVAQSAQIGYWLGKSHAGRGIMLHADPVDSAAPGRKTDPGPAFDWTRLRRLLEEFSAAK